MKILSWNINGIRASKVDLKKLFDSLDADVICLQETKVTRTVIFLEVPIKLSYVNKGSSLGRNLQLIFTL